jgi:hypothetical protein
MSGFDTTAPDGPPTPGEHCACDRRGGYVADVAVAAVTIVGAVLGAAFGVLDRVTIAAAVVMGTIFLVFGVPALVQIKRNHEAGRCPRGGRP